MYSDYQTSAGSRVREMVYRVFGWMMCALTVTGVTSYYIAHNATYSLMLFTKPWLLFVILLMQVGIALLFLKKLAHMSWLSALLCFLGYSFLTGVTLSTIFHIYSSVTIFNAFFITAGMFGSMALYGYFTKADLTSMNASLMMGLWGIIIASLVNIFFRNETFSLIISWVCVVVFSLLTAYDMSKIKRYAQASSENLGKVALYAAFNLYLDFLNLFLAIVRITGRRQK